jgi:hypothetical protein
MQHDAFHDLMRSLWWYMDIDLPANARSEVYSVTFTQEIEVHFLSTHPGQLDIISEAGVLVNKQASQSLLRLLELNYPPLTVSVDETSGSVMVWTRQELATLDRDKLVSLVTHLLKSVYHAKQCIDVPMRRPLLSGAPQHREMVALPEGQTLGRLKLRS